MIHYRYLNPRDTGKRNSTSSSLMPLLTAHHNSRCHRDLHSIWEIHQRKENPNPSTETLFYQESVVKFIKISQEIHLPVFIVYRPWYNLERSTTLLSGFFGFACAVIEDGGAYTRATIRERAERARSTLARASRIGVHNEGVTVLARQPKQRWQFRVG